MFYTFLGIPLGRLADTRSCCAIIAVGIACWSVMTAGCGLARTFWQLALMCMGVGVGEASLSPSAYSLLSDYFRPERRSTAMSVYSMGIYIGSGLAFILGRTGHPVPHRAARIISCPRRSHAIVATFFLSWACRACWWRLCSSRFASRLARERGGQGRIEHRAAGVDARGVDLRPRQPGDFLLPQPWIGLVALYA